jgi:hypothetical protein
MFRGTHLYNLMNNVSWAVDGLWVSVVISVLDTALDAIFGVVVAVVGTIVGGRMARLRA